MTITMRLNLGCGEFPLPLADGWLNLDADSSVHPDVLATVPPLPFPDASADAIYMGHLLEHFEYAEGQALLAECYRVLAPGGTLTVVVPDTRAIMRRWLGGAKTRQRDATGRPYAVADLDDVCAYWLFSTVQPSRHRWAYCDDTLVRALDRAGFQVTALVDRYRDPRLSDPGWWQLGYTAVRP